MRSTAHLHQTSQHVPQEQVHSSLRNWNLGGWDLGAPGHSSWLILIAGEDNSGIPCLKIPLLESPCEQHPWNWSVKSKRWLWASKTLPSNRLPSWPLVYSSYPGPGQHHLPTWKPAAYYPKPVFPNIFLWTLPNTEKLKYLYYGRV